MPVELFYTSLSPPCRVVKLLAERIGLDLKITELNLAENAHLQPDYLKINPFHTVPGLNDNGFHLFESRAIIVYLVCKYAPESDLYPKDLQQRALVDAMLNFDLGTLSSGLYRRVRTIIYTGKDVNQPVLARIQDNLKCLDNVLSTRKYAAADHLTLADISLAHTLSMADGLELDLSEFVHLSEYKTRLRQELGKDFAESDDTCVTRFRDFLRSKKAV